MLMECAGTIIAYWTFEAAHAQITPAREEKNAGISKWCWNQAIVAPPHPLPPASVQPICKRTN